MKKKLDKFPDYAILGSGPSASALIHQGKGHYYRDAGAWGVDTKIINGKVIIKDTQTVAQHLNGRELTPCSNEYWRKSNQGYIR